MENDNGGKVPVSSQIPENDSGTKYTIPGILHFIQHEWARFEMDRAHWDVEKAELQVNLNRLSGPSSKPFNLNTFLEYHFCHSKRPLLHQSGISEERVVYLFSFVVKSVYKMSFDSCLSCRCFDPIFGYFWSALAVFSNRNWIE